jgi:hypothetical protein
VHGLRLAAGPVWVIAAELLRSAAYVALRRNGLRSDLDREWLARLNADKLRIALAYGAAAAAVLSLPTLVFDADGRVWLAVIFLSGIVVALLGNVSTRAFSYGATTNASPIWRRTNWIITVGITIFIAALFMLLGQIAMVCVSGLAAALPDDLARNTLWTIAASALAIVLFGGVLAVVLDRCIDTNRFSMHAVYRNRLVRAFLGTARTPSQRRPDRYAQFDPTDNVRMSDTFDKRSPTALFPVINVTLNVTTVKDTARAERKGEPFVITPLHCGSASLGRIEQNDPPGAYIPTAYFAGADHETGPDDDERGITLGTAMTISGAAMSPNMGYHSSPFVAFVMTLFNVRLGAWLPNPGWQSADGRRMNKSTARRAGPAFFIPALIEELFGISDDCSKYVYLSDGGHFDNLGLYEMLRRRCSKIVVVDAGQDQEYAYLDLSHTLLRAKIDMGLRVTFHPGIKVGEKLISSRGAYAKIVYPESKDEPEQSGEILYLKPWLPTDAPVELTAFKTVKPDFPHAATANQFFTETDFESYRHLGEHLTERALSAAHPTDSLSLDVLFNALRQPNQKGEPDLSNSRHDDKEDAPVVQGPKIQPACPSEEISTDGVRP